MNDVFVEQIEKGGKTLNLRKKAGIVFAALLVSAVFLVIGLAEVYFFRRICLEYVPRFRYVKDQNIEYEYFSPTVSSMIDKITTAERKASCR